MKKPVLALLTALALGSGCSDRSATAVVVAVSSEVAVPEEVNKLTIEVRSAGQPRFDRVYTIVPKGDPSQGPTATPLPGTIALMPDDPDNLGGPVTIVVKAQLTNGTNRLVRQATVNFVEEKQKLLRMPLRFACLDFPSTCKEDETCKAGACVKDTVSLDDEPDFEEAQVFSREGACFDRSACGSAGATVPIAAVFAASTDDKNCSVSLEDLAAAVTPDDPSKPDRKAQAVLQSEIRQGKINFGFTWAANKEKKWTVVEHDAEEGWDFTDATHTRVKLSTGLCDIVRGRVLRADQTPLFTTAIVNTSCEPKSRLQPQCDPPPPPSP